jgi:hypothetical protein
MSGGGGVFERNRVGIKKWGAGVRGAGISAPLTRRLRGTLSLRERDIPSTLLDVNASGFGRRLFRQCERHQPILNIRLNGRFQIAIRLNFVIWSKIAHAAIAAPDTLTVNPSCHTTPGIRMSF